MEESILHGGEKELQELKKTLQEKNRYNAVLDSMDAAVEEQKEWGVVLIDIDRYKGYNDYYGHVQGDECLKKISNFLQTKMKEHF